jgi:putative aminopeptidase FrvX
MADKDSHDLLKRLCLAAGPPGGEDEVRTIVRETLTGVGEIRHDRLGSLICESPGTSETPRVMLDSHLDEVAFMVQSVTSGGQIGFVPLGGWWGHVLLSQRVEILTDAGRVPGVVASKPPHFLTPAERERVQKIDEMTIDIGASERAQVAAAGVKIGDFIVPDGEFREMAVDGVLSCKAFDNRAGVALMCETMIGLENRSHPNTVIGVGSVQEELGIRGAITASEVARPDVAIVLECTPADDLPGATEPQGVLGEGPQIRHMDPTAVGNRRLVRFVETLANENDLPLQMAVRRSGGTDAAAIHKFGAGVPVVVIGVPARYIHSHNSLLQWQDYVSARTLIALLVDRLDADTVAGFTRFD